MDQPLLPIPAACELLNCSRAQLYRLLGAGRLRAKKLGRRTLVERSSVAAFIEAAPPARIRAPAPRPAPGAEPAEAAR
jgi:excisionase family DNA binding protein